MQAVTQPGHPIDTERLWVAAHASKFSEFDVLTSRGISFRFKSESALVYALGFATFGVLFAFSLAQFFRDAATADQTYLGALWITAVFGAFLYATWRHWSQRNDRLVVNDGGIALLRGGEKRHGFSWAQIREVDVFWRSFVRVRSNDGRIIWVSSGFHAFDFLRSFLGWLPEMLEAIERSGGSLRCAVENALKEESLSFRFDRGDVLREIGSAAPFVVLGGASVAIAIAADSSSLMILGAGGLLMMGLGGAFVLRAVKVYRRRHDVIAMSLRGVTLTAPAHSIFVSWAEMTRIEVLRKWSWGNEFNVCGASGETVIDDEPGCRHREVARALLQFFLFREMRARNTWDYVRALDELKL